MDSPSTLPGPLRAFRDRYVAAFGGYSYDLAPGAIGVHPARVGQAPGLIGRRVLISHEAAFRHATRRPAFTVIAVTRLMRDATKASANGGVIFSTHDLDDPDAARLLEGLDVGDPVFLNAGLDLLPEVAVKHLFFDGSEPSAS